MNNRDRLRKFVHKPIDDPFKSEEEQAKAIRKVFSSDEGQKVLDSLIYDMDCQKANLPHTEFQYGFNCGKQYFVHHIVSALTSTFKEAEDND